MRKRTAGSAMRAFVSSECARRFCGGQYIRFRDVAFSPVSIIFVALGSLVRVAVGNHFAERRFAFAAHPARGALADFHGRWIFSRFDAAVERGGIEWTVRAAEKSAGLADVH